MFEGDDQQALQTLIDNGTITARLREHSKLYWMHPGNIKRGIPLLALYGWDCFRCLSQARWPIHTPSNHIMKLVTSCKFTNNNSKETLKLILLQHTFKCEVKDWIGNKARQHLHMPTFFFLCKSLEARCKQYQKQKEAGWELTIITAATSSSIHWDIVNVQIKCRKCRYSHPWGMCPPYGKECYMCGRNIISPACVGNFKAAWRQTTTGKTTTLPRTAGDAQGPIPKGTVAPDQEAEAKKTTSGEAESVTTLETMHTDTDFQAAEKEAPSLLQHLLQSKTTSPSKSSARMWRLHKDHILWQH